MLVVVMMMMVAAVLLLRHDDYERLWNDDACSWTYDDVVGAFGGYGMDHLSHVVTAAAAVVIVTTHHNRVSVDRDSNFVRESVHVERP